jgi:putative spermidine/putrescine transport system permease protein
MAPLRAPRRPGRTAGAGRGERVLRWVVLLSVLGYLLLPLLAMLEFSTRGPHGTRSAESWAQIGTNPDLVGAIVLQIELAALTVALTLVILVPTMVLVQLRLPRLVRVMEFICLLPLTIPAIVLVVGLAPVYDLVSRLFGESALTLTFIYVILVLPFAYRAIAAGLSAIDLVTLAEAARSLGCSWSGVIWRIVVANIRGALLVASLISVALVLGEFTISSLLEFDTLQVVINEIGKRDAGIAVAVSLAALCLAFVLLFLLSFVDRPARGLVAEDEP